MQLFLIPYLPDDEPLSKVRNDRRRMLGISMETHPHPHPHAVSLIPNLPDDDPLSKDRNASYVAWNYSCKLTAR